MRRLRIVVQLVIVAALWVAPSVAGPVDGQLDSGYGGARSTQTTQTSLGDTPENFFQGSELDAAFGYIQADTLHLLLAGNFNRFYSEPLILPNQLQVYIDSGPGGQIVLHAANPDVGQDVSLQDMSGMTFDPEFSPDYWLAAGRLSGGANPLFAYYAELPAGGGGAGYHLGRAEIGGPGTLSGSGAYNPYGILASIDISNEGGVTEGCDAGSGMGVTTGIEWAIPLAAIGGPSGSIRVCALIVAVSAQVSNQILGPVPPGTCALGAASGVDFGALPGQQYFEIDAGTPATKTSWGQLKSLYR